METTTNTSSFIDNLADDATLSGAAMNGFISGKDTIRNFLQTIIKVYDGFTINTDVDAGDFRLQEYTATVKGYPVAGTVLLKKNINGQYNQVVVNHRPLSSLLIFSSLASAATKDTLPPDHFYRGEPQSLDNLLDYFKQSGSIVK